MVDAVQRPRGPLGWSPAVAHLGWPSDTTPADRERWRREYDGGETCGMQMPPRRNPIAPPGYSVDPPGLTGKTRQLTGARSHQDGEDQEQR